MTVLFSTEQAQPSIYLTKRRLKKNDWFWIAESWALTTNVGFLKKLTLHVTNRFLLALHEQITSEILIGYQYEQNLPTGLIRTSRTDVQLTEH